MAGRLQKYAATIAAVSALTGMGMARADAPAADDPLLAAPAGTTVRPARGWSASLFVGHLDAGRRMDDESVRLRASSTVNAQLSRKLSPTVRLSLDVFNVFDRRVGELDYFTASRLWSQPGTPESFLVNPAEPRGIRLRIRKTF